jgi:hypothetical protein
MRPWTGKKGPSSHRKRVSREAIEMAITAAVKESDPQCEPFVGVLIEHHAPKRITLRLGASGRGEVRVPVHAGGFFYCDSLGLDQYRRR